MSVTVHTNLLKNDNDVTFLSSKTVSYSPRKLKYFFHALLRPYENIQIILMYKEVKIKYYVDQPVSDFMLTATFQAIWVLP